MWLTWLLGLGAIFGWTNFGHTAWQYANQTVCTSCPHVALPGFSVYPPLGSPCFYGALIYTIALIIALIIYRRSR